MLLWKSRYTREYARPYMTRGRLLHALVILVALAVSCFSWWLGHG